MKLNRKLFQKVIDDLEKRGAKVKILAQVINGKIDYTIFGQWKTGRKWEIKEVR